jgi:hypothetical protein
MFIAQPLLDREQLGRALKPGTKASQENALRGLRKKGLLTEGLQVARRGPDGRVAGRASLYSSLNRDVLVLLGKGLRPDAEQLARQALRIERMGATRDLSAAFAERLADGPFAAWEQVARDHQAELAKVVRQIERSRNRLVHQGKLGERWSGRVTSLAGPVAELRTEDGRRLAVPVAALAARSLDVVGGLVSFSLEDLGGGESLMRIEPALEIGVGEDTGEGLPPGVSLLDFSRIGLPGGASFEDLLPEATIPVPIALP